MVPAMSAVADSDNDDEHKSLSDAFGQEYANNYFQSLELLDNLLGSFPLDETGSVDYPDAFGGVYFNENGELVVLLVESGGNENLDILQSNIRGNVTV
jgi:hypothetical protein